MAMNYRSLCGRCLGAGERWEGEWSLAEIRIERRELFCECRLLEVTNTKKYKGFHEISLGVFKAYGLPWWLRW